MEVRFQIELHRKDEELLKHIQAYFGGIGSIYSVGKGCLSFRVSTLDHILKIIDHFNKYPLITHKLADYKLFCNVVAMMQRKEHLTREGLEKIVASPSDSLVFGYINQRYKTKVKFDTITFTFVEK